MSEKKILLVDHAPSPNTRKLRDAVLEGARDPEVEEVAIRHVPPLDATPEDVLGCDAIILGTTENLAYMAGAMKDFFDRVYYPVLEETQGLPYGLYVRAGNDGAGTIRAIETIVTGLRWRAVQDPLLCRGEFRDDFIGQARELGLYVAAAVSAGII
ncbi:MAG: flavodoxin [Salinisphaeraceae bacterium]|nr:flavodoxin [Salinisphaeraceae bacterium]